MEGWQPVLQGGVIKYIYMFIYIYNVRYLAKVSYTLLSLLPSVPSPPPQALSEIVTVHIHFLMKSLKVSKLRGGGVL